MNGMQFSSLTSVKIENRQKQMLMLVSVWIAICDHMYGKEPYIWLTLCVFREVNQTVCL